MSWFGPLVKYTEHNALSSVDTLEVDVVYDIEFI